MKKVYSRPRYLKPVANHYGPGCGHSIVHRLICEVVEEMKMGERVVSVAPAGCAVLAYFYFDFDTVEAAHGRGAAVATGIKRSLPEALVFSYQGDGDLAAIGTAETIHAASRGERVTVIFINNGIYGMTGGQMAPTTLLGMKATTAPEGRSERREGFPLDISHLLAEIPGSAYITRTAVNSPKGIRQTKKAISEAFQCQLDDEGFSLVEVLSMCPTNWKLDPAQACAFIDEKMSQYFKPGVLVDRRKKKKPGPEE
jgi:2-oxoglutarate/2-oxoacid ferredoxin oxidoreductase subunit beta